MSRNFQTWSGAERLPPEFPKSSECSFSDIRIALHGRSDADTYGTTVTRKLCMVDGESSRGHGKRTESCNWRFSPVSNEFSNIEIMDFASDLRR